MYYNAGRVTERPSLPQTDGVWWRLAHVAAGFPISCDFSSFHPRAVVPSWPHILFSHFLVNGPVWDGPGSAACSCVVSACVCADTCWYSVLLSCTHTHTHTGKVWLRRLFDEFPLLTMGREMHWEETAGRRWVVTTHECGVRLQQQLDSSWRKLLHDF